MKIILLLASAIFSSSCSALNVPTSYLHQDSHDDISAKLQEIDMERELQLCTVNPSLEAKLEEAYDLTDDPDAISMLDTGVDVIKTATEVSMPSTKVDGEVGAALRDAISGIERPRILARLRTARRDGVTIETIDVITEIIDALVGAFNEIVTLLTDTLSDLLGIVTSLISTAVDIINSLISTFTGLIGTIIDLVTTLINEVLGAVTSLLNAIVGFITALIEALIPGRRLGRGFFLKCRFSRVVNSGAKMIARYAALTGTTEER